MHPCHTLSPPLVHFHGAGDSATHPTDPLETGSWLEVIKFLPLLVSSCIIIISHINIKYLLFISLFSELLLVGWDWECKEIYQVFRITATHLLLTGWLVGWLFAAGQGVFACPAYISKIVSPSWSLVIFQTQECCAAIGWYNCIAHPLPTADTIPSKFWVHPK